MLLSIELWSCDCPTHVGAKTLDQTAMIYGCSNLKTCNWSMCGDCWKTVKQDCSFSPSTAEAISPEVTAVKLPVQPPNPFSNKTISK